MRRAMIAETRNGVALQIRFGTAIRLERIEAMQLVLIGNFCRMSTVY